MRYFDPLSHGVAELVTEAASEADARAQLLGRGMVVLSMSNAAATGRGVRSGDGRGFSLAWWCRELRTLLLAGMTVVEALETLHLQSADHVRRTIHAALLKGLHEGRSLSDAMESSGAFPAVLIAGVKASERTSTLVAALDDYLRYDEMLERLRKQAVSAAIYPAVVVGLGMAIVAFLVAFVIPRFSRIYLDIEGAVSVPTQILLTTSALLNENLQIVGIVVLAVASGAVLAWRRGALQRIGLAVLAQIEPLQRQWDHYRLAKLYQSLALMFRGGYTLDEALAVCASLDLGSRIAQGLSAAQRRLAEGRNVSLAFSEGHLCDLVAGRLLGVGERTGGFDKVLQTIADRHAEAFALFIERATRIVEPVLLLLVALMVGGIVVLMYMPIFDIANSIQ